MNIIKLVRMGLFGQILKKILRIKTSYPKLPEFGAEYFMPGQNSELHNGFVNCAHNTLGLRAQFYEVQGTGVGVKWRTSETGFEGFPGMIHGGVLASLVDEVMAMSVFRHAKSFGVTVSADLKWHKPIRRNEETRGFSTVHLAGNNLVQVKAYLYQSSGKVAVSATGLFFLPSVNQFKRLADLKEVPSEFQQYFRK